MQIEYYHPQEQVTLDNRYKVWQQYPNNFTELQFDVSGLNGQTWHIKNQDIDLWDLAIDQAREIRANNDYVRVWFSGGFDSTVVLESFRRANIKPDEIRILDKDTTNGVFPLYHALEIENNGMLYLEQHNDYFKDVKTVITPIDEQWINEWYTNNPEFYKFNQHVAVLCWCCMPHMIEWTRSVGEKPSGTIEVIGGQWPNLVVEDDQMQCVIVDKQLDHPWHPDIYDFNLSNPEFTRALVQKYIYQNGIPGEGWTKIQSTKNQMFNFSIPGATQMLKNYPKTRYAPADHLANYQVAMWQRITYAYATLANPQWWPVYQKIAHEQREYFDWNVLGPGILCRTNIEIES